MKCGFHFGANPSNEEYNPDNITEESLEKFDDLCSTCDLFTAKFVKLGVVITNNVPSESTLIKNLARYACICQSYKLVPMLQLEILADGLDIEKCFEVTGNFLAACYEAFCDCGVHLQGTLLIINLVTSGSGAEKYIANALLSSVPPAVKAVYLSVGTSEEEDTLSLNALTSVLKKDCWGLGFTLALNLSVVKAWSGRKDNVEKVRRAFLASCTAKYEDGEN